FFLLFILPVHPCLAQVYQVGEPAEFKARLNQLKPGDELQISPGNYRGISLKNIHGTAAAPIIIQAEDPYNPPIFKDGAEGLKLSGCSYLKFENLVFRGFSKNGINIDDAGKKAASHHIILEHIQVLDTGGKGNQDAIKMSGVTDFILRNCDIEGWGGSAIDLVGCRNGIIEDCTISGKEGFRSGNGIQIKGGSHAILVQNNLFRNAGARTVQIGGLTGKQYFRPAVGDYEAKNITIAGNTFIGSEAQIAWVTAQDSHVHNNLFFLPEKWLGRILQETQDSQFKPSQRGLFERNVVVTDQRVKVFFNVGQGTEPQSFVFRENLWFRPDADNRPNLPVVEKDGVYDVDPMVLGTDAGGLQINSAAAQLQSIGPNGYQPWPRGEDFADIQVPPVEIPEVTYSKLDWLKDLIK
ncbi:MAG: right-handed parallel beta-helix repeat-containing protein, partial [Desulfuromonas sp.]